MNPLLILSIFAALVLNLLGGVTRRSCNFALHMFKIVVACAMQEDGRPTSKEEEALKDFPSDIRSVQKFFDLEPAVTVFAACPNCSSTYEPSFRSGI
ncbi:uncharacterized protein LAESUDRAFT_638372, partial [Laetiporus sulphureus 93-53]